MQPDPDSLPAARWTHVALPVSDMDRSVEFYTSLTPLVVVSRHEDEMSRGAWLSNDGQVDSPFVLVLIQSLSTDDTGTRPPIPTLTPFAHLGIELPTRSDVDAIAERARALGVLHWEAAQGAPHVGYVCAARDPDGNVVEFSWNQQVYAEVRRRWATPPRS